MIDMGGQWVHGQRCNVVYEMVWPLGLLSHVKGPNDESLNNSSPLGLSRTGSENTAQYNRTILISNYVEFFDSSGLKPLTKEVANEIMAYALMITEDWPGVDELKTDSVGDYLDVK